MVLGEVGVAPMCRACRTFWPASEPRLPACAQSGFGSQGSWVGGSPRWAISSVQVSCRRRSSSSVSLSTTSSQVCPSTALILCTTWAGQVGGSRSAVGTLGSTWTVAPPGAGPGSRAGSWPTRGGRLDGEASRLRPPPPVHRQLPPSVRRTPDTGLQGHCRAWPWPRVLSRKGREAG